MEETARLFLRRAKRQADYFHFAIVHYLAMFQIIWLFLRLGVSTHLVEDRGNQGLEMVLTILADSALWDIVIILD